MRKYSKASQDTVKSAVKRAKKGTLKSGKSRKAVKSRKQAIAIGLSEARQKGQKVPSRKKASSSATKKRSTATKKRTSSSRKKASSSSKRVGSSKKRASSSKKQTSSSRKRASSSKK